MAGVIMILRKALEQIGSQQPRLRGDSYELDRLDMINTAREALQAAARLSQDCLRAEQPPDSCADEHVQYSDMCG